uniref:PDZ domain-containing protein n=1 Tax=Lotharella oceanica TaxID=641309 RepID=A0A7S2THX6_9EUKA|mmetsp:Transcript_12632/g.24158  ORF Transcript_12632/g.24158 Transcript_12632/m.24158 type:complete len:387 (+) Transcript_12632:63-1223(+)
MAETSPRARKSRVSMIAEEFARMGSIDDKPSVVGKQVKRRMSAKILEAKELYEGGRSSKTREARKKSVAGEKESNAESTEVTVEKPQEKVEETTEAPKEDTPKSEEHQEVEQESKEREEEPIKEETAGPEKTPEEAPVENKAEAVEPAEVIEEPKVEPGKTEGEAEIKVELEKTEEPPEEPTAEAEPEKEELAPETKAENENEKTKAAPETKVDPEKAEEAPETEPKITEEAPVENVDAPVSYQQVSVVPTKGHDVGVVEKKTILVETTPFGLTSSNLLVLRVWGAAKEAGVCVGDRIVKVNKIEVTKNREMKEVFADSPVPFEMEFTVGDEASAAKATAVLARLEEQEQEQKNADTFMSRRHSEVKEKSGLSEKATKKSGCFCWS